jgi:hypothetical protein
MLWSCGLWYAGLISGYWHMGQVSVLIFWIDIKILCMILQSTGVQKSWASGFSGN